MIIIIICLKQSSCDCKEEKKNAKCIQDEAQLENQNTQFD